VVVAVGIGGVNGGCIIPGCDQAMVICISFQPHSLNQFCICAQVIFLTNSKGPSAQTAFL